MKKKFFAFFGATVILFAMLLGIYVKYIRYDSYMVFVESFGHGVITVEKYNVTFDANGGTINGGNTYIETEEYYVPDTNNYVPTFGEHTFMGWYKDPEFKEPAVSGELLKENVTFYAKWEIGTYEITLDLQQGTGGTQTISATFGSEMPAITTPTRANTVQQISIPTQAISISIVAISISV